MKKWLQIASLKASVAAKPNAGVGLIDLSDIIVGSNTTQNGGSYVSWARAANLHGRRVYSIDIQKSDTLSDAVDQGLLVLLGQSVALHGVDSQTLRCLGIVTAGATWQLVYERFHPAMLLSDWLAETPASAADAWQRRLNVAVGICSDLLFFHDTLKRPFGYLDPRNVVFAVDGGVKLWPAGMARCNKGPSCRVAQQERSAMVGCHQRHVRAPQSLELYNMPTVLPDLAPEERCLNKDHSSSFAADMYAAGVLLLELLAAAPHEDRCPLELINLLQRCTKEDPSKRPSIDAVHAALLRVAQGPSAHGAEEPSRTPSHLTSIPTAGSEPESISHTITAVEAPTPAIKGPGAPFRGSLLGRATNDSSWFEQAVVGGAHGASNRCTTSNDCTLDTVELVQDSFVSPAEGAMLTAQHFQPHVPAEQLAWGAYGALYEASYRHEVVMAEDLPLPSFSSSQPSTPSFPAAMARQDAVLNSLQLRMSSGTPGMDHQRFLRQHRHILRCLGMLQDRSPRTLLFERCWGGTLSQALTGTEASQWQWQHRGMQVAMDVCEAIQHLHQELGWVHGHISSSAVHLTEDGVAKLGHLYYAKPLAGNRQKEVQLEGYLQPAANQYTAPELCRDVRTQVKASKAGDVYALGVLMAEILFGSPLSAGWSPADVRYAVQVAVQLFHLAAPNPPMTTPSASRLLCRSWLLAAAQHFLSLCQRPGDSHPVLMVDLLRSCLATQPGDRPHIAAVQEVLLQQLHNTLQQQHAQPALKMPVTHVMGHTDYHADSPFAEFPSTWDPTQSLQSVPSIQATIASLAPSGTTSASSHVHPSMEMASNSMLLDARDIVLDDPPTVLGKGGFGEVYAATWQSPAGPVRVAVKAAMHADVGSSVRNLSVSLSAFLKEVDTLQQCQHPNIVLCLGVACMPPAMLPAGSTSPWPFRLLFELCAGDLRAALESARAERFQWKQRGAQIAADVCEAVRFLHVERNLCHMDIKSSNVLLGFDGTAKLGDFGLSTTLMDGQDRISATTHTMSPLSSAPEVVMEGEISKAADVFSLGIVMWELLVGTVITSRRHMPPLTPSASQPIQIVELVQQCTHPDASRRPNIQDVCDVLAGKPREYRCKV